MTSVLNKFLIKTDRIDASEYHQNSNIYNPRYLSDRVLSDATQALKRLIGVNRVEVNYDLRSNGEQYLEYMRNGIMQCVRLMTSTKSTRVVYMKLVVNGHLNYYRLLFSTDVGENTSFATDGPASDEEGYLDSEEELDIWTRDIDGR